MTLAEAKLMAEEYFAWEQWSKDHPPVNRRYLEDDQSLAASLTGPRQPVMACRRCGKNILIATKVGGCACPWIRGQREEDDYNGI